MKTAEKWAHVVLEDERWDSQAVTTGHLLIFAYLGSHFPESSSLPAQILVPSPTVYLRLCSGQNMKLNHWSHIPSTVFLFSPFIELAPLCCLGVNIKLLFKKTNTRIGCRHWEKTSLPVYFICVPAFIVLYCVYVSYHYKVHLCIDENHLHGESASQTDDLVLESDRQIRIELSLAGTQVLCAWDGLCILPFLYFCKLERAFSQGNYAY